MRKLLPSVTVEGNKAAISQSVIDFYRSEQQSRTNQYVWESAFFLLALMVLKPRVFGFVFFFPKKDIVVLDAADGGAARTVHVSPRL